MKKKAAFPLVLVSAASLWTGCSGEPQESDEDVTSSTGGLLYSAIGATGASGAIATGSGAAGGGALDGGGAASGAAPSAVGGTAQGSSASVGGMPSSGSGNSPSGGGSGVSGTSGDPPSSPSGGGSGGQAVSSGGAPSAGGTSSAGGVGVGGRTEPDETSSTAAGGVGTSGASGSLTGSGSGGLGGGGSGTGGNSSGATTAGGGTSGTTTSGGGTSGASTSGGVPSGGDGPGQAAAAFTVTSSLSSVIPTVGIVEWSVDVPVEEAVIEFGREAGNWEYQAPVDLQEPTHRTLLLGMKPNTTYSFQIVVTSGSNTVRSEVQTLATGFLPNGLPPVVVTDHDGSALYGGFTTNCTGMTSGTGMGNSGSNWAFIIDRDGDYVWAYNLAETPAASCSRARMSFDGKHMWAGNFSNVSPDGALTRVSMDGMDPVENYSIPGRHHDFTVLPNNHVLYYEQENGGGYTNNSEGPDIIKELDPETGESTLIYHENTDFEVQITESGAHTNQINYVPHLNAISFSLRHTSTIGLITYPEGSLLGVFGGPISDFEISWDIQHGHEVLEDTILIFNNNGSNNGSSVIEFEYDLTNHTATKVFDYSSGLMSMAFGDVKRLKNGNSHITYSSAGVIHEISGSGQLLREMTIDAILGYTEHRKTLYGPPPPVGE